ncbi:unnamed protein product (plasmid) [Mycetohabitans rhizoxinica HKI 454]|uniref:LysM domain-containing protein n=1 Tax=Mycetohabitans rhizoxinica (strain DSM 19002 / CIP 109453 / HKI 454) TaxID=882378 RepID=E5AVT4_MYCRK|nr:LysM domain-containing protein [Mycetohabitans rhizoxinica]CBW77236.1 unnamed protein product [Mycetohabitans rhizoxinica HKI 454]
MGFAKIKSIDLTYRPNADPQKADKEVEVTVTGSFRWLRTSQDDQTLSWYATDPTSTPAPPGQGNEFLELRLLAMGQHVEVKDLVAANNLSATSNLGATIQHAIGTFTRLPPTSGETKPAVDFSPGNSWLIGTDFGLLKYSEKEGKPEYACTLQFVFNDPELYALRIALAGPPAKILDGLDFGILYRKISDTVGVYELELTLPNSIRTIECGVYTIQLPVIGVCIYTNGDFQLDIGFPWKIDFSRSFTVQAIVYPGIPLMGSGGFYFGKLPGTISNSVPQATNGTFDPVIVFGFGAQLGLGKSLSLGPLQLHFSVTVLSIIEGVLARWNPNPPKEPDEPTPSVETTPSQMDGTYYYRISGTFGVAAIVNGVIDFAVVRAAVNLSLVVTAQIVFAAYEPIAFTVEAVVDVSASIKIKVKRLFSITIRFHFSQDLTTTFTIQPWRNVSAPWQLATPATGRLGAPLRERLTALRRMDGLCNQLTPKWDSLAAKKPATSGVALNAYLTYALTAAGDAATRLNQQLPCYIATLVLDAPQPESPSGTGTANTSFDELCKLVTRWVVAAFTGPATLDDIDERLLCDDTIDCILLHLQDTTSNPQPIPADALLTMLAQQVTMTLWDPNFKDKKEIIGAFFPMPPELSLNVKAYEGAPAYNYTFSDYNTLSEAGVSNLRSYFDQLALQVDKESPAKRLKLTPTALSAGSVASFVFTDYFLLVARQCLTALRTGLRDYKWPLPLPGDAQPTPQSIVDAMNNAGNLAAISKMFTLADLFTANASAALATGSILTIANAKVLAQATDSFASIAAQARFGSTFTAIDLARANQENSTLLQPGQSITINGHSTVTQTGDTLSVIASRLRSAPDAFLTSITGISNLLFMPFSAIALPAFPYTTQPGDTLAIAAAANGITVADLAAVPANGAIAGLFDPSTSRHLDVPHVARLPLSMLLAEAQDTGAFSTLSGMISRYHLHGLRLPTSDITANSPGMWVAKPGDPLPSMAGLYALTGQQFPVPPLAQNAPFTVTLGLSDSQWIAFENGGSTIDFSVSAGDEDGKAVEDLRAWIHSNHLDTDVTSLGLASRIDRRPASFGLGASIRWDSSTLPSLPFGAPQAGAQFTRIAPFPASMANVLARNSHAVPPAFTPIVQSYDEASKRTVSTDIVNYGWATTLAFSVKQVPKTAGATVPCTYEVLGAGAADVALLEDVVAQLQGEKKIEIAGIWLGLAPPPSLQASGGIQTALDASFGIGQANLSTQTNPPERMKMAGPQALNGNAAFLTLLWEASITASGGFYLYYSVNGKGLPDHVFNSDGIATLTLVIVYAANNQLGDYTNALVFTDPVDNSAAISIQAVPQPTSDNQLDSQGIAELAAAHYTDLVDVARDNATTTLKSGAVLAINGGTYMVSPQGAPPGGNVTDIAAHFETAAAAIQAANPRIPDESWQGSLPAYTALRLPPLTITVGTSPGGTTLQSLVAYYGIDAVSILVDNQDVGGLFATPVSLAGGPVTATSSLPPDSQFYRLQRPVPADSDSPKELLLNNFSLLGYRVDGITPDFVTSNLGVPVGPTGGGGQGVGKMRRPRQQRVGDSWIYDVALSYGTLVTGGAEGHPYQGIGRLLQVDFQWLDLYGNTIISDLTSSITDSGGSDRSDNRLPTLTGYTDDIVALSQWPSASASWSVMKKDRVMEDKLPQLTIVMNFDPSRYQTDTSDAHRDPVANATADLQVYGMLQKQFGDSAGMMVSVETSLATAPLAITGANREGFDNFRNSIVSFLTAVKNREQGTPPGEVTLSLPLSSINQAQVIELACAVTIARQAGIVEGEFSARPGIRSRTTTIGPKGAASGLKDFASELEGAFADNSGVPLLKVMTGPNRFDNDAASATSLWAVRIGPYGSKAPIQYSIKNTDEDPKPAATIFAPAPLSTSLVSRRQVALCPFESYDLSNPVKGGINWSAATDQQNFIDIDLDTWAAKLFAAVDELLTPEYISALVILDNRTGGDNLARLQANKSALADRYAKQMQAVFEATNKPCGDTAPKEVVELFRQTLLGQLGNAYNTQAAVHFPAKVEANIAETPPPDAPPRLYGQVVPPDAAVKKPVISVTNARLPLTTLKDTPFVFLVTTSAPKTSSASVQLALEYRPSHIEHQIAKVPGIEAPSQGNPYMASSWLQFVNPPPSSGQRGSLSADLGSIDMPMVLRAYPTSPILSKQAWKATDPLSTDLTTATQWNYCATYFLPLHSPQDTVHVSVAFNVDTSTSPHATIMGQDCFDYAAQFITTYPKVRQELVEALARIDDNTTDFTVAQHAMDDVNKMLEQLRDSIPHEKTLVRTSKPPGATSTTGLTSVFTIREMADSCGRLVVEVAVQDGLPPAIEITGWQTTKTLPSQQLPPGVLRFSYQDVKTGKWLNFADAQSIGDRTITFSELQIMQAQDAIATVHVSRNDNLVKGRTTCDAFVYRTPNITFPNSLQPNLISTAPIDIGAKRKASLEDHLNTLFTTLVSDPAQQPVNVQLECYYTYTLGTNVKSLPIPIGRPCAMQVPTRMSWSDTPSEGSTPRVQMVANFAGAIITWFNKALPSGANGRLHFSLTIMPSETKTKTMPSQTAKKKQKPLLTLTDLTLSLANILPTKGLPVFTK